MIRTACLAAMLTSGALLPIQSVSAAVNLNARIALLTSILHTEASFSQRDFSFAINSGGSQQMVFKGLDGVRNFNNYAQLNSWLTHHAESQGVFEGGPYKFTHSVLGSYFTSTSPAPATPMATVTEPMPTVFEGAPYKFTHSVLGSYFDEAAEPQAESHTETAGPLMRAMMAPPPAIPEPATWAMMIAGFALAGVALRYRVTRTRIA